MSMLLIFLTLTISLVIHITYVIHAGYAHEEHKKKLIANKVHYSTK